MYGFHTAPLKSLNRLPRFLDTGNAGGKSPLMLSAVFSETAPHDPAAGSHDGNALLLTVIVVAVDTARRGGVQGITCSLGSDPAACHSQNRQSKLKDPSRCSERCSMRYQRR